jgi:Fe-S cluster biogenesis protein NfuA
VQVHRKQDGPFRGPFFFENREQAAGSPLASQGGQISIVDLRDGKLLIAMSGGCQGCTASQVTLKNGLELMVRRVAPEIVEIVDTTDHTAGKKPFYPRAGEAR